jgi:lysophospholipase L1-like esterase
MPRALGLSVLLSVVLPPAHVSGQTTIIDNADPAFTLLSGTWNTGAYGSPYGPDYRWAASTAAGTPSAEVEWRPNLPAAGEYEICVHYVAGSNRAENAPFGVHYAGGSVTVVVNQQVGDSTWVSLGTYPFEAGTAGSISLGNAAGPTVVIADAVRFRRTDSFLIIPGTDPRIVIGGALFAHAEPHAVRLDRIDPLLLADPQDLFSPSVAVLTTGVTIRFRTDSASIRANFDHLSFVVTEGTGYAVFQDGVFDRLVSDLEAVDIPSGQPGVPVTFEIACPSYDEVTLADLELDADASLFPLPPDRRPRYFALGDSITHGSELDADTKADSTASYPWMLARSKGWHLFNVAVGGSRVTPAFGGMLSGQQADVITILWGLNDKARDNDLALFVSKYDTLLDNLRGAQPRTAIHCITPITSASEGPGSNGYTLDDYRDAIAALVATRQAAGDCHLHLIRGEDLTALADLSDGVHFSVAGAERFAASLAGLVGPAWGDFDNDGAWSAEDWPLLAGCVTGPGATLPPDICQGMDLDCDQDVDLTELAAFQRHVRP